MYCQKCGAQTDDQAAFCDKCGTALQKASPETGATAPTYPAAVQYAGFWRRLGAAIIDGLIVGAVTLVIYLVLIVGGISTGGIAGFFIGYFIAFALAIILGWLYYALMERSLKQATLGKMARGSSSLTHRAGVSPSAGLPEGTSARFYQASFSISATS
jgi:hypothetical protein